MDKIKVEEQDKQQVLIETSGKMIEKAITGDKLSLKLLHIIRVSKKERIEIKKYMASNPVPNTNRHDVIEYVNTLKVHYKDIELHEMTIDESTLENIEFGEHLAYDFYFVDWNDEFEVLTNYSTNIMGLFHILQRNFVNTESINIQFNPQPDYVVPKIG